MSWELARLLVPADPRIGTGQALCVAFQGRLLPPRRASRSL